MANTLRAPSLTTVADAGIRERAEDASDLPSLAFPTAVGTFPQPSPFRLRFFRHGATGRSGTWRRRRGGGVNVNHGRRRGGARGGRHCTVQFSPTVGMSQLFPLTG